jgi:single-strand DNA-binding protein
MNSWNATAYLVRDPERVETNGGTTICHMRIGVERAGREGKDGYFDVKCFGSHAEACLEHLRKGRRVAIEGRLQFEEFETKGGDYASRVSIVANWVEFLPSGGRRRNGGSDEQAELPQEQPAAEPSEAEATASS